MANQPLSANFKVPEETSEAAIQQEVKQVIEKHFAAKKHAASEKLANAQILLTPTKNK